MVDPGQRGDPGLIQPVVSQRNHVQTLGLIENGLRDFLNQVVLQVKLLNDRKSEKMKQMFNINGIGKENTFLEENYSVLSEPVGH